MLTANKYPIPDGAPASGRQVMKSGLDGDDKTVVIGEFFNDTGLEITKGQWLNATGIDAGTGIKKGVLLDASNPAFSSAPLGMCLDAFVSDGTAGRYIRYGNVTDCDTTGLSAGAPFYASDTVPGGATSTRPVYPNNIVILGTPEIIDGSAGKLFIDVVPFRRIDVSAPASFTSRGISSGVFYKNGFYDWDDTGAALDHTGASITYGAAGKATAAHVGIVPAAPGVVESGQVGIRVTGTLDSETGVQVAAQTQVINDDITTLTADEMEETTGKFSGTVTIELYVVSGAPAFYGLSFNYGFSKYEDFFNRNATVAGFQAQWQGNANDTVFNIKLLHHKREGWTYAATGFDPGNGVICERLVDQAIDGNVVDNQDGVYKRLGLDTFIESGVSEGIILEITTGQNNTIQTMDMNVLAYGEDLA